MRDYVKCHLNDGGEKIMLKCDVCEGLVDLDDTICEKCGFDNHIIPDDASPEIQEIERKRIEAAKKVAAAIKQLEDLETALKKEQTAHEETKSDLENEKTAHERTKSNLAKEQTAHNRTKDALKDEEAAHEETKADLKKEQTAHKRTQDALKDEKAAHEETKSDLEDEKKAHERMKAKLVIEKVAHEKTKKKLDDAIKNTPTQTDPTPTMPIPNKKVIGKALFTQAGRSEAVDLYEGVCRVTAPAWTNVKGELFEIQLIGYDYILTDLKGYMYNRLGNSISSNGVVTFNDDYFTIGNLLIKLSLPENN
jgi:hypothetical protein